jgi:hypothetical protein
MSSCSPEFATADLGEPPLGGRINGSRILAVDAPAVKQVIQFGMLKQVAILCSPVPQ